MEPVGFAIGVAGLAGTFTACVDCFEYVQLGRKFGADYCDSSGEIPLSRA